VIVIELADFNGLRADAARRALHDCCSSARWIDVVQAGRPYGSVQKLLAESDAAVAEMSESDLREALAGHPRIGERHPGQPPLAEVPPPASRSSHGEAAASADELGPASWSSQEQARVSEADAVTRQALADGNLDYEERFGHIYLACATGRSAGELLAFLRERLGHDRETEWQVVAAELAKINRIRLAKLIGAQP
jgi:2-oxo-4-hydroxy-4-carboxy-5-ureidoimidazoline decarboxylase